VVADRVSRRRLLLVAQSAMMLLAAVLTLLTFSRVVQPWHLIGLGFLGGIANAFDAPARQSFVVELVPREDLTNAIALNSTIFNTATAVGPMLAGLAYAWIGPTPCFAINTVSFLAVIGALLAIRLAPGSAQARTGSAWQELGAGLRFVAESAVILPIVITAACVSVLGVGMMTLMPAWAVNVLGGGPRMNGLLLSARGVGSLSGSLTVAALGSSLRRGRLLVLDGFLLPALMLLFALFRSAPLALCALCAAGWAIVTMFNTMNALIQTHTPDELRGRVMGLYTMTYFGLVPIGALLYGASAARLGEQVAVAGGAMLQIAVAGLLAWRWPSLRRLV
jgi:predicted MFS family arabinose efflux permease